MAIYLLEFVPEGNMTQNAGTTFTPFTMRTWYEGFNWSFANLHDVNLREMVSVAMAEVGSSVAFAPKPGFNAAMIPAQELTTRIELPGQRRLMRSDVEADGIILEAGETFAMTLGGCGLIVLSYREKLAVLHASQKSLVDDGNVHGRPTREIQSIVDAALHALEVRNPSAVWAWGFNFIEPMHWWHSLAPGKYQAHNQHLKEYVRTRWGEDAYYEANRKLHIKLAYIAMRQILAHGVPTTNINFTAAYFPKYLPHTRLSPPVNHHRYLTIIRSGNTTLKRRP